MERKSRVVNKNQEVQMIDVKYWKKY